MIGLGHPTGHDLVYGGATDAGCYQFGVTPAACAIWRALAAFS